MSTEANAAEVNPAATNPKAVEAERTGRVMLELKNLVMRFGGVTALREVNLTINEEIFALIGPNGAERPRSSTW